MEYTPNQRKAIKDLDKGLMVIAGAGSGKTFILVEKYIEILRKNKANGSQILAITFTEKAALEMKERIKNKIKEILEMCNEEDKIRWRRYLQGMEKAFITTIHSFCAQLLREYPIESKIDPNFLLLNEIETNIFAHKIVEEAILSFLDKRCADTIFLVKEYGFSKLSQMLITLLEKRSLLEDIKEVSLKEELEKARSLAFQLELDVERITTSLDMKAYENKNHLLRLFSKVLKIYEEKKDENSLLDFEDLLIKVFNLLSNKKKIKREIQEKFPFIMVDEFQDIDILQKKIILLLLDKEDENMAKSFSNFLFIGDPKQSIYGFRGAEVDLFNEVKSLIRSEDNLINLRINFRSSPNLIKFQNNIFKFLWKDSREFDSSIYFEELSPFRKDKEIIPPVELILIQEEDKKMEDYRKREAILLGKRIKEMVENKEKLIFRGGRLTEVRYSDIAILFRSLTSINIYEEIFKEYYIPYHTVSGRGFYFQQEIKDILNLLKIIQDLSLDIPLAATLRSPFCGISDISLFLLKEENLSLSNSLFRGNAIQQLEEGEREKILEFKKDLLYWRSIKDKLSIHKFILEILYKSGYETILLSQDNGVQKVLNVRKLLDIALNFEKKGIFTLVDFINYIEMQISFFQREALAPIEEEKKEVLKIMSIHAAKGLEFPVVFIPDISRKPNYPTEPLLINRMYGVGLKVKVEDEYKENLFYSLLKNIELRKELSESRRLLYVAITRAKDYLIFSGVDKEKPFQNSWWEWIKEYCFQKKDKLIKVLNYSYEDKKEISILKKKNIFSKYKEEIMELKEVTLSKDIPKEAFNKFINERINPKLPYPNKRIRYKATEFDHFRECPYKYKLKYIHLLPEERFFEDHPNTISSLKFGNILHELLKRWNFKERKSLSDLIKNTVFDQGIYREKEIIIYQEEINNLLSNFQNSSIYKELIRSKFLKKELPFIIKIKDKMIEGIIDLLFKDSSNEWVILDYKTEKEEDASKYNLQMNIYALAVKNIFKVDSIKTILYFLYPNHTIESYLSKVDFKRFEEELINYLNLIESDSFDKRLDRCSFCRYSEWVCLKEKD